MRLKRCGSIEIEREGIQGKDKYFQVELLLPLPLLLLFPLPLSLPLLFLNYSN